MFKKCIDIGKFLRQIEQHIRFEHRLQIGRRDLGLVVLCQLRNTRQGAIDVVSSVVFDDDEGRLHVLCKRLAGAFQIVQINGPACQRITCIVHNKRSIVLCPFEILIVKGNDHKPYCLHDPVSAPEFAPSIVIWIRLFPLSANRNVSYDGSVFALYSSSFIPLKYQIFRAALLMTR